MTENLLGIWFNGLEAQLALEAQHAGLLNTPSMVGNAREFLVNRVLKSFLPPALQIGSGCVIAGDGHRSKQVDVIVFDPSFPAFQMPDGQCLYPVEGVIAVIEVKSTVDSTKLKEALENCFSVNTLLPEILLEDEKQLTVIARRLGRSAISKEELVHACLPRTYVFAFKGLDRAEALMDAINGWLAQRNVPSFGGKVLLPSVIVTGGAVGLVWGDPVAVADARTTDDKEAHLESVDPIMQVWSSATRFGWLASHLLYRIQQREFLLASESQVFLSTMHYLPFEQYFNSTVQNQKRQIITRLRGACK